MNGSSYRGKKSRKPRIVLLLLKLLVAVHLLIAGLSQLDSEIVGDSVFKVISTYMIPIFKQKWNMFAPNPLNYSLEIRYSCKQNGPWEIWQSALKKQQTIIPSISLQKKIFYFDSYSNAVDIELQSRDLIRKSQKNLENQGTSFFSLPVAKSLISLLRVECAGSIPVRSELVRIPARLDHTKLARIKLWGS